MQDVIRVLSLQDYNTRIVFLGTTALGAVSGMIGTFLLLRKRSLLSDTISHATLPGIALTFIIFETLTGFGKSLPLLLLGALLSGLAGMGMVILIRKHSSIKDDAALAIVLSVLFGLGISLITLIQQMPTGNAAGLEQYIYGKAASMTTHDMHLILSITIIVAIVGILFYKEFAILCFDVNFAVSQGLPSTRLDIILMSLIVVITVIGLQAVGLLLVVALLIIPAAAARFWSERLFINCLLSTILGAISCFIGITCSALFPKLPAGAIIVLAASLVFALSMIFGTSRGLLIRFLTHYQLTQRVQRQHLLRACYEHLETSGALQNKTDPDIPFDAILTHRLWSKQELEHNFKKAVREGLLELKAKNVFRMTDNGWGQAQRVVRNHRLWEMYLIEYADIAPGQVDRDADAIEHILEPELMHQLEDLLQAGRYGLKVPTSPHKLQPAELIP
ncbi:MAG: iron chelate uptake ABC transporter family permease subunit [Verrucomicrobiota bacterium]